MLRSGPAGKVDFHLMTVFVLDPIKSRAIECSHRIKENYVRIKRPTGGHFHNVMRDVQQVCISACENDRPTGRPIRTHTLFNG